MKWVFIIEIWYKAAMHLGIWSKLRLPRGTVRGSLGRRPSGWRGPVALALACLTVAVTGALPASAAETGAPNVVVHQDILNNLDWAAAAAARIRSGVRVLATEGTTLKQPPASPPVSYVLIAPERIAPSTPPTRKPTAIAESSEPPAPAENETGPAALQNLAEAGGASASPAAEPAAEAATAQEIAQEIAPPNSTAQEAPSAASEAPPVIPTPPEPTGSVTIAEEPIVTPSPPDPQPALPETVVLAEAAPEPEPEPLAKTPKVESKPAKKSKAKKTQTALRLPATLETGEVRLVFPQGSVDLSESAKEKLGALAQQLQRQSEADRRIQLQAFASSSAANASAARRLSLARALAVRTFLIEKGVRSRRIDVRALGAKSDEGPPDRVDILDARS